MSWLQKRFMKWFNAERLKKVLTFPVETVNLLDDGKEYVDKEWADFAAEMYAEGHSFFTYRSNSVDALASCCFDGSQKILTKSSGKVSLTSFAEFFSKKWRDNKKNLTVFHNGNWVKAKPVATVAKNLYRIVTTNNKELVVTKDHIHPTLTGDKATSDLTVGDYLLFSTKPLPSVPEHDTGLTYEEGFLIGMYLGDGSIEQKEPTHTPTVHLSLNQRKYETTKQILARATEQLGAKNTFSLGTPVHNVYPLRVIGAEIAGFIREFVFGKYANEKRLNLKCLLESEDFRRGIYEGLYATDGGNNNRIYTTSSGLAEDIEALFTTLGIATRIDISDRTDEPVVIRGKTYTRNYPLYCIRWYANSKRGQSGVFQWRNNSLYFRVVSIEPYENENGMVYCFEMKNEEEPYFTLPNGIITHNCRLRNEVQENVFSYTLGAGGISTGSKGVITININRLVQNAVRDGIKIETAVEEQVKKIHKYLTAWNEILKDFYKSKLLPVYDAGFIALEKQYLTIGINGFVEAAQFLGIDISPNEKYFKFGEQILKPIYTLNRAARTKETMFNTEFVPAENLGVKNAKWDKEDGYVVPRNCYNSYFYKVEDEDTNLLDKFILHGDRLTRYLDGGSALHANLDEHLSKEQYRKLLDVAIRTGCSYFTFNIPNTICNSCGHISKRRLKKCPKCGSENLDYATRVIGYLKRVSAFSEARQEEEKRRYYG